MHYDTLYNDEALKDELVIAAMSNLVIEGGTGFLESYKYRPGKIPAYLDAAVQAGYKQKYDAANGDIKNMVTVTDLLKIKQSQDQLGFGSGMFQYTFARTEGMLNTYKEFYDGYAEDFTAGQKFAAEYTYFREEMEASFLERIMESYSKNTSYQEPVKNMAVAFRKIYEGNSHSHKEAEENAKIWEEALKNVS